MKKIVPTIDVSKSRSISDAKEILKTFKNACKSDSKIRINPVGLVENILNFSEIPRDHLYLDRIDSKKFIDMRKKNTEISFQVTPGKHYEFLIESPSVAFFFISKILSIKKESQSTRISVSFPRALYEIKRRNFFRYTPFNDQPLVIEFEHSEITHEYEVGDISAGGLSFSISRDKPNSFIPGDFLKNLSITFAKEKIVIPTSQVIAIREQKKQNTNLICVKFINLDSNLQDKLVKYIFEEHRIFLSKRHTLR